jgi:hypothetical protein
MAQTLSKFSLSPLEENPAGGVMKILRANTGSEEKKDFFRKPHTRL